MVIWFFLSTFCEYETYWMSLQCSQAHPKIPGFEHLQGKNKRNECESAEMNYFPESQQITFNWSK